MSEYYVLLNGTTVEIILEETDETETALEFDTVMEARKRAAKEAVELEAELVIQGLGQVDPNSII